MIARTWKLRRLENMTGGLDHIWSWYSHTTSLHYLLVSKIHIEVMRRPRRKASQLPPINTLGKTIFDRGEARNAVKSSKQIFRSGAWNNLSLIPNLVLRRRWDTLVVWSELVEHADGICPVRLLSKGKDSFGCDGSIEKTKNAKSSSILDVNIPF